jgi:uncharacterized SAM-binding protein YcdF (DUF218 family)
VSSRPPSAWTSGFAASLAKGLLGGLALVAIVLAAGFVVFALTLARQEPSLSVKAEGIVAFTGGSDRVIEAAAILARGQAQRLLITGVNRATRSSVLARLLPVPREMFNCCVDLGYEAQDTAGNARETRQWAQAHHLTRSLIVVTSNYHMPRALLELSAVLPGVELYPFPVVSEHVDVADWPRDLRVAQLVGGEYVKYLRAIFRITFAPDADELASTPLRRTDALP